jgi:SPP1 family predicted phage head-tail adaptor
MESGQRDRVITIQQRSATDAVGSSGMPVETWTTLVDMWAQKREMTGSETYKSSQWSAKADLVFEVNYRPDMDPEIVNVAKVRRLLYRGRVHDITYVEEIGRREGLKIYTLVKAA